MAGPSFDVTTLVKGAGTMSIDTLQLFSSGDLDTVPKLETFDIEVDGEVKKDTRIADGTVELSGTPSGKLSAAILAAMYPHGTPTIDSDIFGATATPTHMHSRAGTKVTWHRTAVIGSPSIKLSARATSFASALQILALIKNDTARDDAAALYTIASTAWSGTIAASDIPTLPYTAIWDEGGSGEQAIYAKDGWEIEFDIETEPFVSEDYGTLTHFLKGVTMRAKCTPMNLSETLLNSMLLQGTGATIGSSIRTSKDMRWYATNGMDITMYDAAIVEGPLKWGRGKLRAGDIGMVANADTSSGAVYAVGMYTPA